MANEVFLDTSGFFALLNRDDSQHERAQQWMERAIREGRQSFTTEWVIGESCTLLNARRRAHLILTLLDLTERSEMLTVMPTNSGFYSATKTFLRKHLDQGFSFVDCTSFVVMRELGLHDALTADRHFIRAGFNALLL